MVVEACETETRRPQLTVDGEATRLLEESPHATIRAHALYARAQNVMRNRKASDADKEAAQEDLRAARQLADGTLLADRIDAPEFEKNRLQIGMEAPDITGEDLDGNAFNLSDYRGKVVVLDFWGDW